MEELLKELEALRTQLAGATARQKPAIEKAIAELEAEIAELEKKAHEDEKVAAYAGEAKRTKVSAIGSRDRWDSECNGEVQKISLAKTAKGKDCYYFEIGGKGFNVSEGTLIKALENFPDILLKIDDEYETRYPLLIGATFVRTRDGEPEKKGDMYPTTFSVA